MNRAEGDFHPKFTPRQGQYLAFIHAYTLVNERPPAQADIQRFFRLTPPSVYQMLLTLEREGLISRRTGVPRSIAVLIDRALLPALEPARAQPVKITVQKVLAGQLEAMIQRVRHSRRIRRRRLDVPLAQRSYSRSWRRPADRSHGYDGGPSPRVHDARAVSERGVHA